MNDENLIPFADRTESEQREIRRKGGKASGKARRERKTMRETAEYYLNLPQHKGKVDTMDRIRTSDDVKGANLTNQDMIILKHIDQARKGNNRSAEFLRDLVGERPTDRQEVTVRGAVEIDLEHADIDAVLAEIRRLKDDLRDRCVRSGREDAHVQEVLISLCAGDGAVAP